MICIFIIYALKVGVFESPEKLVKYIKGYGVMAPIIFIFIQIIQVEDYSNNGKVSDYLSTRLEKIRLLKRIHIQSNFDPKNTSIFEVIFL